MFPLSCRIRIAMCCAMLIGLRGALMSQQAQPRTLYSFYDISRTCQAEDGRSYTFEFVSNIFTSPSTKFHNNAENEARQAFEAMIAAEGWSCHNYGNGTGQLIRVDTQANAKWYRDGDITSGKNSGFGIVEYNYFDGAARGSAPQQISDPR